MENNENKNIPEEKPVEGINTEKSSEDTEVQFRVEPLQKESVPVEKLPEAHLDEKTSEEKSTEGIPCEIDYNKTIYSNARSCAVKILCRCERTDAYLDKLIDSELRNTNLNDFDKSLLNELTHGVIRWLRRLDWFLNGFYRGQYEKCLPEVKNAMRVALYQILFLNKIP